MTSAYDDIADPRARAEAIVGQARLKRMEQAGLMVVDRSRLEALERLYRSIKHRDELALRTLPERRDGETEAEWHARISDEIDAADEAIDEALAALEAIERGNA
ncbi:hypothetical protein [Alicyclobacillus macrosporangiidus]|uniref:Uncharacterized protein n=1 Tax=Alicyclobacillus macrosporangiidus TaxID=392015 RepID=A0A1I7LEG4_9BACL|nr:hypothetical protein [Alicyclobacillus macrosporangiidus]SFV08068.1 hypothetical protein SAMN05421543_14112 [Alicyclobacillus macrosporangiidus]